MSDALKNDPLLPLVTEIVVAYLSHNTVAMNEIPRLIAETRAALANSGHGTRACQRHRHAAQRHRRHVNRPCRSKNR